MLVRGPITHAITLPCYLKELTIRVQLISGYIQNAFSSCPAQRVQLVSVDTKNVVLTWVLTHFIRAQDPLPHVGGVCVPSCSRPYASSACTTHLPSARLTIPSSSNPAMRRKATELALCDKFSQLSSACCSLDDRNAIILRLASMPLRYLVPGRPSRNPKFCTEQSALVGAGAAVSPTRWSHA
jgi:hypothetical protein